MKKIKFAIVGCGRIGTRHALQASKVGVLVAVCDIVSDKARQLASDYNVNAYSEMEIMLTTEKDIDVVAICTPNGLHALQSIKALRSGFHVLCEKPMALDTQSAQEMITAAKTMNRELFIVKQNRFNPPVVAVKQMIKEGKLGKIYSFQLNCFWNRNLDYYKNSWHGDLQLDGGTLFTQFSHFIDLLYWLIGDVSEVKAFADNFNHQKSIAFEDSGVVILKMKTGVIGTMNYTVNSYQKNMEGSFIVFAEKGTVKIGGQYLNELEYQQILDFEVEKLPAGNPANNYGHYQGSMSNHNLVYLNIVNVLSKNAEISTTGFEGLKTVEIIQKIYACFK